jgi:small subunit ribosomal protein S16
MALKIRLRRMGRKKAPTYRIVVAESSMPRDGRFVEILGHYNPRTEPMTLVVDSEKAQKWMKNGARPTETVEKLFKRAGVYEYVPGTAGAVAATAVKAAEAVKGVAKKAAAVVKEAAEAVQERVTGATEETTETVEAPAAEVEAPAAEVEAPAAEVEAPAAEAEAPAAEVEEPAADEEPRA